MPPATEAISAQAHPGQHRVPQGNPITPQRRGLSSLGAIGIPLLLGVLSLLTTTANGARFVFDFRAGMMPVTSDTDLWPWGWLITQPALLASGWVFSLALLSILLLHEFGHYAACMRHGIRATLPWLLPAPTLSGTAGAIIRLRGRIPHRNALMDIGVYGPICGYVASLVVIVIGLALSRPLSPAAPPSMVHFGIEPLSMHLLHKLVSHWVPALPDFPHLLPHPVLLAGWIGLFITSLNLIPGGQLDGGHLLYALSPELHRQVTRFLPYLLLLMGLFCWLGWLLWGAFLLWPRMRHPKVPVEPELSRGRVLLAFVGLLILLLSFTPMPFHDSSLLALLHKDLLHQ